MAKKTNTPKKTRAPKKVAAKKKAKDGGQNIQRIPYLLRRLPKEAAQEIEQVLATGQAAMKTKTPHELNLEMLDPVLRAIDAMQGFDYETSRDKGDNVGSFRFALIALLQLREDLVEEIREVDPELQRNALVARINSILFQR
ncbi:MAG TPA: hypothetical protein VGJ20_30990 [Xanthobacteraceae bacterium]